VLRADEALVRDVVRAEGVVDAGRVEKHAVLVNRADDDGIGGRFALGHDQTVAQALAVAVDDALDEASEGVIAYLPYQAHRHAEFVEGEAGVRDDAPGGEHAVADFD